MRIWRIACWLIVIGSGVLAIAQTPLVKETARNQRQLNEDPNVDAVVRDQDGVLRHLRYHDHLINAESLGVTNPTPRSLADAYLRHNAAALSLDEDWLVLDDFSQNGLSDAPTKIQLAQVKSLGNATVVSYVQTRFGLLVWQAGISATIVDKNRPYIVSVTNSANPTLNVAKPEGDLGFPVKRPTVPELASVLGVEPGRLRIKTSHLIIYQYHAKERTLPQADGNAGNALGPQNMVPTLPLQPVADSVQEAEFRVVNEVLFTLPVDSLGDVNWRVFIDLKTASILNLRAGVAFATGIVFESDPISMSGNSSMTPFAAVADLDHLRSPPITLLGLAPPVANSQKLTSSGNQFVMLAEIGPPALATITEKPSPFEFGDSVDTDDFAAVSAYYHTDAAFRLVESFGIDVKVLFAGTDFPVPVDHRALGDGPGASAQVNSSQDGLSHFLFGRAARGSRIGMSADRGAVLHEFAHAILFNSTHRYTLPFAESGGDSLAAIINAPNTKAPDPSITFPWTAPSRRHDRSVSSGWGWGGPSGITEYDREQILSTTLFRMYRAIGGDDSDKSVKTLGSRYGGNLIVRGLGLLNPYTPASSLEILESAMIAADKSTTSLDGTPGGAVHKIVRWAFAKQGAHRPAGASPETEGGPPAVDVYIDDGRNGDYLPYLTDWTKSSDIWNRLCADGGSLHQTPARFRCNYIYVLVKNRGTEVAKDVSVRLYHRVPGATTAWPLGMQPVTTAVLPSAGNSPIAIPPGEQRIVGPFSWQPTCDEDQLLASVSASGDLSNIDPNSPLPVNAGPTALSRLVPFDNNIAQLGVHSTIYYEPRRLRVRSHTR
jgi:hypothetical protein